MPTSLSAAEKRRIENQVRQLLAHYRFRKPPVPIAHILREPPGDLLTSIDLADLSLVFGKGEHRYEYRMAIARLIYRELCRQQAAEEEVALPYTPDASHYFAAALLIPRAWIQRASLWPWNDLYKLSETFQVPHYVMAARLTELGKRTRGMT